MMSNRPLKRVHLKRGQPSLECLCLRDGTLDVDLITGVVTSRVKGRRERVLTLAADKDGYLHVHLSRERPDRRGTPKFERNRKGDVISRHRNRRYVRVHRLVKMKELAVKKGGIDWRPHVKDLPLGVDIDHGDLNRANNHHENLTLKTEAANRGKREMTQEEADEIAACTF